ncbi:MAG: hypothetical protein K0S42_130 [Microvirga sp.]|jgi:hypothetical protein|nr:hypothetical protein [Microvirga sp.]
MYEGPIEPGMRFDWTQNDGTTLKEVLIVRGVEGDLVRSFWFNSDMARAECEINQFRRRATPASDPDPQKTKKMLAKLERMRGPGR